MVPENIPKIKSLKNQQKSKNRKSESTVRGPPSFQAEENRNKENIKIQEFQAVQSKLTLTRSTDSNLHGSTASLLNLSSLSSAKSKR